MSLPLARTLFPLSSPIERLDVKGQTPQVKGQTPQVKERNNRGKKHIPADLQERILQFCNVPRTIMEIVDYLGLKDRKSVRVRGISPLVEQCRLVMTIPQSPNSRFQKYITIKYRQVCQRILWTESPREPQRGDNPTVNPTCQAMIASLPDNLRQVYELLSENPRITYAELERKCQKHHDTIYTYLKRLRDEYQLIERIGADKNGYWKVKKPPSENSNGSDA